MPPHEHIQPKSCRSAGAPPTLPYRASPPASVASAHPSAAGTTDPAAPLMSASHAVAWSFRPVMSVSALTSKISWNTAAASRSFAADLIPSYALR